MSAKGAEGSLVHQDRSKTVGSGTSIVNIEQVDRKQMLEGLAWQRQSATEPELDRGLNSGLLIVLIEDEKVWGGVGGPSFSQLRHNSPPRDSF